MMGYHITNDLALALLTQGMGTDADYAAIGEIVAQAAATTGGAILADPTVQRLVMGISMKELRQNVRDLAAKVPRTSLRDNDVRFRGLYPKKDIVITQGTCIPEKKK